MSYDDEIRRLTEIERITDGKSRYVDMDEAFCTRLRLAITAGLESAPTAVVTTWNQEAQIHLGPNREIPSPAQ